jgi:hypothetical protein
LGFEFSSRYNSFFFLFATTMPAKRKTKKKTQKGDVDSHDQAAETEREVKTLDDSTSSSPSPSEAVEIKTPEQVASLTRKDLQALCKDLGIKANLKVGVISELRPD